MHAHYGKQHNFHKNPSAYRPIHRSYHILFISIHNLMIESKKPAERVNQWAPSVALSTSTNDVVWKRRRRMKYTHWYRCLVNVESNMSVTIRDPEILKHLIKAFNSIKQWMAVEQIVYLLGPGRHRDNAVCVSNHNRINADGKTMAIFSFSLLRGVWIGWNRVEATMATQTKCNAWNCLCCF